MMSGKTYVDGTDIYAEYGVYVTSGGWNGLVAMPSLKSVDSNDWQEEDGIEEDLSAPVLDTKEATVSFACGSSASRLFDFIALLSDGAYHEFDCRWIGRKYRLRMVSQSKLSYNPSLGTFSLKLADDFPLPGYEYEAPESGIPESGDYILLDDPDSGGVGTSLTAYGVRVLSGTLSNVLSTPNVKTNLLRNLSEEAGAEYDGESVTFKSKDVKVQCLMRAETLDGLWRNWDALLYDLTRPGERGLYVAAAGQTFPCRYKSCSVSAFNPEGRIWLQFTVTLTFTRDLRVYMGEWLLSTEDGALVTTEDGEDCVDMRPATPAAAASRLSDDSAGASRLSAAAPLAADSGTRKVRISELAECADLTGLWTLGTDSGNSSVKVSLEFLGTVADSAENAVKDAEDAARIANDAATNANSAASSVVGAVSAANDAASNANSAAASANDAATAAASAATNASSAAESANSAAEETRAATQAASDAAVNANEAAQACLEAAERLLEFLASFKVTAEGEYPLILSAENTGSGADITGNVDISEIADDDITRIFNENS